MGFADFEALERVLVYLGAGLLACSAPAMAAKKNTRAWAGPTGNVVAIADAAAPHDALGSGVMFPGGKVLTDCHIFKDVERLEVRQGGTRSDASLTYADRKRELCELKVARPERFRPAALKLRATRDVVAGETIYAVAGTDGDARVSEARVVKVQSERGDHVIHLSSRLAAGFSGGALFDRSGALIGIVTRQDRSTRTLSYAYPAEVALQHEEDERAAPVPYRTDTAPPATETTAYRTLAEDYLNRLAEASRASLKYPEEARGQSWSGTTSIRFDMDPGGELRQSFVDVSSGYAGLDVTALLAVRKAIDELPIPELVKEKGLKGTVSITFVSGNAGERRE
jgi:TonB family protein